MGMIVLYPCLCRWSCAEACCLQSRRRWPAMHLGCYMMICSSVTWWRRCCNLRRSCGATSHTQQYCLVSFTSCLKTQSFRSGSLWKRRVSCQVCGYISPGVNLSPQLSHIMRESMHPKCSRNNCQNFLNVFDSFFLT